MKKYQAYCCVGLLFFFILSGWIGVRFYIEYLRLMVMSTVKAPMGWALEDIENDMSRQKYADAYIKIKVLNNKWQNYSSNRELSSCDFGDIPLTMTKRSSSDSHAASIANHDKSGESQHRINSEGEKDVWPNNSPADKMADSGKVMDEEK